MHDTELSEIEKYCSPKSVLVVNKNGELVRLACPFKVIVLLGVEVLQPNSEEWVTEVKISRQLILAYVIKQKAYHYFHFSIIL